MRPAWDWRQRAGELKPQPLELHKTTTAFSPATAKSSRVRHMASRSARVMLASTRRKDRGAWQVTSRVSALPTSSSAIRVAPTPQREPTASSTLVDVARAVAAAPPCNATDQRFRVAELPAPVPKAKITFTALALLAPGGSGGCAPSRVPWRGRRPERADTTDTRHRSSGTCWRRGLRRISRPVHRESIHRPAR